jgi:hypothetical protein
MTRIEKVISLYTALTGDATVTAVEVNKYAGLSESVSLEAISATITADSPINFGAMPVNDLLNYLFVNLFGKTQAEVDALRATTDGAAGFQYWADEIANNPQVINLNTLAIALLNGAEAAEANGNGTDATNAAKKVEGSVADYNAAYPDSGNPSETEGQTFTMTDGRDMITGTAGNDTINAFVGQNKDGALANAFATGDYIDGGAGTDTLFATLMNDNEVDSGTNFDINVRTKNVEIVKFEVLDEGVVVDAGTMDSVKEFWSVNSDDSGLTLEDVRLGTKQSITKDITFAMQDVDFGSDLTVGFDSNSFKNSGDKKFNSKIVVEVGDSNKEASSTNPLELIKLTLQFTFNGQDYSLNDIQSTDGTYEGLKAAITTALSDKGLSNLVVSFGNSLTQIVAKNDTVDLLYSGAKQIVITDPNGEAFTNFKSGVAAVASQESSNPVSNTNAMDPNNSSTLIESNLILDNAGRGSTAGSVQIGAMSNSKAGIEQFNVMVDRDSAIADLKTTNDKLQNIIISSRDAEDASKAGANGSLEIGKTQAELKLIDASAFKGANLMLGATTEGGNTEGILDEDNDTVAQSAIVNLTTLNANIAANVTFNGTLTQDDGVASGIFHTFTTGSGNDTIVVNVDGDSVDTIGEGLSINAGNGNNTVKVTMDSAGVSKTTTEVLDNLSITTGTGDDKVTLIGGSTADAESDGDADFNISTGAGSDFVYINSIDDSGTATAAKGTWTVGSTTASVQPYADTVLYKATLTVNFAGFEQKINITTTAANKFVATQVDINNAIKAAIAANPELAKLLTTEDSTGTQGTQFMTIKSTVEGLNELAITVDQPNTLAADVSTTDISALNAGFVKTGTASTASDDATEIAALLNNAAKDATIVAAGNGGSANETSVTNVSVIDLGKGAHDLVVLNSHDDSTNTIKFSASWDKVSVVNFEDNGDIANVGVTGLHKLDFSAWLDDKVSSSGSALSEVRIDETVATATTFGSNTVVTTSFTTIDGLDGTTGNTFATLTDAQVLTALNADATYGSVIDAGTIGTTRDSMLLIENADNLGEYKVYNVEFGDTAANNGFTSATLVGTIDFGDSVTLANANVDTVA